MSTAEYLKTLMEDPLDRAARRAVSRIATRRVGLELEALDLDERPDLSKITDDILSEAGKELAAGLHQKLRPVVRSIVEGVFDDDEPTGVTELLTDWGESGRVDEENLYGALQVVLLKRIRWILSSWKFNSLRHKVSPGDLMNELFLKLQKAGVPKLLENRAAFFRYSEAVLRNYLKDVRRAGNRDKRAPSAKKQPLEDLLRILDEGGVAGGQVSLPPEELLDVYDAIDSLPKELQDAILYRYFRGFDVAEVAKELGISEATVKRHSSKALVALRRILSAQEPETLE